MTKRKKSPTKIIEETEYPALESAFLKFPGELIDISGKREPSRVTFQKPPSPDAKKYRYRIFHTHTTNNSKFKKYNMSSLPSSHDFSDFLEDRDYKTMGIVERNSETGKVLGYTLIRKTNKTPENISSEKLSRDLKSYDFNRIFQEKPSKPVNKLTKFLWKIGLREEHSASKRYTKVDKESHKDDLDEFCDKYGLQYKQFPNKNLERLSTALLSIGSIGLILFITLEFTGNVISNSDYPGNFLFIIFLLLSLISGYIKLRNKKILENLK